MARLDLTTDKNKWIEAVAKLTALTQKRRIYWHTSPIPLDLSSQRLRGNVVYEGSHMGKTLRLYEKAESPFGQWTPVLELVDSTNAVWAFPSTEAIAHLLAAVQYQIGQVGEFVDALLAEAV